MTTVLIAVCGGTLVVELVRGARRASVGTHARAIGTRARWRLPAPVRLRLARALADSAIEMEPEEVCELALACGIGATALTAAIAPRLVPVVVVGVATAVPVGFRLTRGRARQRFEAALPEVLERIASALRGGVSLGEAIETQAIAGPVAADLRRVRARQALGLGLAEAVSVWPEERPLASVRAAAGAFTVASTMGGRSAAAIDGLAMSLREQRSAAADAHSLSAQARLSALVVGAAPVGFLLLSAIIDPASVDTLVGTGIGRVCLVTGLLLELAGVLWMRRIVGSDA
ncbi:MAG TPA: type II secretion system F family protein [Acidimicrobiia bacterium]|nr:type II secretion system F family protein [Acidimicrobiia bacterium]